MRKLLLLLGLFAVFAGCGVRGATFPGTTRVAPTEGPGSLSNLSTFCQNAPTVTAPGTYPFFESFGVLSGTTYTIDPSESEVVYIPVVAASSSPTTPPTVAPSPNPSASPYDVWSGTVTYTGTPHDATLCFLAAAYVSRASIDLDETTDNAEAISVPEYQKNGLEESGSSTSDTLENFVLTLSDTTVSSGSFTLAGGGHASISITAHGVYTNAQYRQMLSDLHRKMGIRRAGSSSH